MHEDPSSQVEVIGDGVSKEARRLVKQKNHCYCSSEIMEKSKH